MSFAMSAKLSMAKRHAVQGAGASLVAAVCAVLATYPVVARRVASGRVEQRLERLEATGDALADGVIDATMSLRVQRLGPLLASWETVGGCGAGGTGGTGVGVKWIGHNTTGGLFHTQVMSSYLTFKDGYNIVAFAQIDRDLDTNQKWNTGVIVPYLYKYYRNYLQLAPPTDISNAGLGDVNVFLTRRLGPINATSITASLGLPTGVHDAQYKFEYLTQDKQLGLGNFTGSLMLDHTMDQSWGLIVLGGLAAYRGGRNDLGNYRAPMGSLYSFVGYFLGPFVPSLGLSFTGFTGKDQDRGIDQDLPLSLVAGNASIEWSNDYIAVLTGVQLPFSFGDWVLQPWVLALGVSVSPF